MLLPLSPIYAGSLGLKNVAYSHGWLATDRLCTPVISVGNLSVGGAGKTPLVICLAGLLKARGFDVDVLSRGYRRNSGAAPSLVMPGQPEAAALYGDEPVLIARAAGAPVYVGADRYAAGLLAEQKQSTAGTRQPRLHLLDDGFQHRRLARAADVVVLHRSDFSERLLPAGRLREPLSALRRASIAVLRVADADLEPELLRRGLSLPVWHMTRSIALPLGATESPAVAFCGIAHPQDFFSAVTGAGAKLTATRPFGDHHAYTPGDIRALTAAVRATGAKLLLTTEKDLVRLIPIHRALLEQSAPLHAVPLRAGLLEEEAAITQLLALAGVACQ